MVEIHHDIDRNITQLDLGNQSNWEVELVAGGSYYIRPDVTHKWIGETGEMLSSHPIPPDSLHLTPEKILCAKGKMPVHWLTGQVIATIDNSIVDCPECLEWIHA